MAGPGPPSSAAHKVLTTNSPLCMRSNTVEPKPIRPDVIGRYEPAAQLNRYPFGSPPSSPPPGLCRRCARQLAESPTKVVSYKAGILSHRPTAPTSSIEVPTNKYSRRPRKQRPQQPVGEALRGRAGEAGIDGSAANMPEVVEQQIQVPAPMSATNSGIEAEQPKPAAPMSTSGDDVDQLRMRSEPPQTGLSPSSADDVRSQPRFDSVVEQSRMKVARGQRYVVVLPSLPMSSQGLEKLVFWRCADAIITTCNVQQHHHQTSVYPHICTVGIAIYNQADRMRLQHPTPRHDIHLLRHSCNTRDPIFCTRAARATAMTMKSTDDYVQHGDGARCTK
ncbi:hypothetical protein JHW43_006815 [Diplocarpon mali]|nr:hypothetical protein JHW43_006815 [Diplocarpon mali]